MFILLELIFQGFFEWVYGLILECWEYFFSSLLDIMSLDFVYIKAHVPVVEDITQVFLAVGWALLLGNLAFQAIRGMASGLGFEGEDPKLLFARTFVFSFLLLASPQICEIGLNLTSRIMALLEIPDVIDVHLVDSGLFGTLSAAWLLVIICDIIIMFKVLKLLLEVAERYVILAVLSITAPLAFSMGGSKSTSEIFTGWCRMFGSMCLLMVTNVMFFKMLLSVVSTIPSGLDVFPWMVLIITIVKVAKKADEIITRIGLNPAITGDRGKGMGGVLAYTVIRKAASTVVKTIGAAATGGGTAAAGAVAGAAGTVAGAAGMAGAAGAAGAVFRPGEQRSAVQSSVPPQEQGPSPQGRAESTAPSGQSIQGGGTSRKTSVPKGTRRSVSHVAGSGTDVSGAASSGFGGSAYGGGTGRGTIIRHSAKVGGVVARRRPIDVFVGDDFDDGSGQISKSGIVAASAASDKTVPAGGANRSGLSSGAIPSGVSTKQSRSRLTESGAVAGQAETRSTRRDRAAQTTIQRQDGTERTIRITQTSSQKAASAHTASETRQRSSSAVRQESGKASASAVSKGSASVPRPGPAGTGDAASAQGTVKQRSPTLARQEIGKPDAPSETPAKGGALVVRPGQAGTAGGMVSQTSSIPKGRSSSPARQEQRQTSIPTEAPLKGGGPAVRPGPAEIKSQALPKRQGRTTQRKPDRGGPEHGK